MTTDRARKQAIRARMAATGEPYSVAARHTSAGDPRQARSATVTAIHTAEGGYTQDRGWTYPGWHVLIHDPVHGDLERPCGSGRVGVAFNDRDLVVELLADELAVNGWTATGWPAPDPVPDRFTLTVRRNELGEREDQAQELYAAAGATWHTAHHGYLEQVAAAVAAAGVPVCDLIADCDRPRGGSFRIGVPGDIDFDPETGWGPADYIMWREDRGWYEVGFTDAQQALGDYAVDLPGDLGTVPPPAAVTAAVRQRFGPTGSADAATWTPPGGGDPDPPRAEDDWDVSPAFERSLLAYAAGTSGTRADVIV